VNIQIVLKRNLAQNRTISTIFLLVGLVLAKNIINFTKNPIKPITAKPIAVAKQLLKIL